MKIFSEERIVVTICVVCSFYFATICIKRSFKNKLNLLIFIHKYVIILYAYY